MPKFHAMAREAGRDPAELPVSMFGGQEDLGKMKEWRDLGVERVVVALDSVQADTILPVLDRWAAIIRGLGHDDR
jgi:hypothetical protein